MLTEQTVAGRLVGFWMKEFPGTEFVQQNDWWQIIANMEFCGYELVQLHISVQWLILWLRTMPVNSSNEVTTVLHEDKHLSSFPLEA